MSVSDLVFVLSQPHVNLVFGLLSSVFVSTFLLFEEMFRPRSILCGSVVAVLCVYISGIEVCVLVEHLFVEATIWVFCVEKES